MTKNAIQKRKKITLDDLAAMCMREFTSIREKMSAMETGMATFATKGDLSALEQKMDRRFDRLETIVMDHTFRIQRLEQVAEAD